MAWPINAFWPNPHPLLTVIVYNDQNLLDDLRKGILHAHTQLVLLHRTSENSGGGYVLAPFTLFLLTLIRSYCMILYSLTIQ
ncbi:hypothetical protein BDU57DRAFT_29633 [Ampelomyces quisqualis]|uniref:Uncharacterized protein n=1 Tax=Ampelomyces quisqualis TaxID=50730 RepID=A0A6A5QZS9_AMPQU|nr:hypothetical protein BDU57DRAFT_29633 [Ampelomyces quisqualis]